MDDKRKNYLSIGRLMLIIVLVFSPILAASQSETNVRQGDEENINTNVQDDNSSLAPSESQTPLNPTNTPLNAINQSAAEEEANNPSSPPQGFLAEYYSAVPQDQIQDTETSTTILFFETIFIILVISVVLYLIFRYISKRRNIAFNNSDFIRVIGTQSIALGKYIQIVEIANKFYILGVGEGSVNLITEIGDQDLIDRIKLQASKELPATITSFKDQLKDYIKQFQQKGLDFRKKSLENQQLSKERVEELKELYIVKEKADKLKNINVE